MIAICGLWLATLELIAGEANQVQALFVVLEQVAKQVFPEREVEFAAGRKEADVRWGGRTVGVEQKAWWVGVAGDR